MEDPREAIKRLNHLPEELLDHIVSFLDQDPPSLASNPSEPSIEGLFKIECPLKALSLTSKAWRKKAAPRLFQYLRLSFEMLQGGASYESEWEAKDYGLSTPGGETSRLQKRRWQDSPSQLGFEARLVGYSSSKSVTVKKDNGDDTEIAWSSLSEQDQEYAELVMDHIAPDSFVLHPSDDNFSIKRFPALAKRYNILQVPLSLVVYTSMDTSKASYDRKYPGYNDWAESTTWMSALKRLNPDRLVLIAPPSTIAAMTDCWSDISDAWAFSIPYQRVELCMPVFEPARPVCHGSEWLGSLNPHPRGSSCLQRSPELWREDEYRSTSKSSSGILHACHWKSMEYDEGSSLNAYGTYHYFEKRPPCILSNISFKLHTMGLWLQSFTYRAIFPHYAHFITVLDVLARLCRLRQLRLQLAPDPNGSRLLDDQEFVGRGNLSLRDCWNEVEKCYEAVVQEMLMPSFRTGEMALEQFANSVSNSQKPCTVVPPPLFLLQEFISDDYRIEAMHEVLDGIFERYSQNRWVKSGFSKWSPTYFP